MRIPLHIKLMGSYLVVVGLVLLPTGVYLRTTLTRDQRNRVRADLTTELVAICDRLGEAPRGELEAQTRLLLRALPTRLTVVSPDGRVLGDSARDAAALDNHGNRPEIRAALRDGVGSALRMSATTHQVMLYVAMRCPREGAVRAVARLAQPEASINAASEQASMVIRNTSAVALSVAVLLSLVAALAASRPLRRIAAGARAFAAGDFGAAIDVSSSDEIGEVAEALAALASQLRARLLTAGADRATLQALLDELPVAVVLYDAQRQPVAVNGAARTLCDLAPHAEASRGAEIPRLDGQGSAVQRALRDGLTVEAPLVLPWRPGAALAARWLCVFAPDGQRLPALLVVDRTDAALHEALHEAIVALSAHVRALAAHTDDAHLAVTAMREVLRAEALRTPAVVRPSAVTAVTVRVLFEEASGELAALAEAAGVSWTLEGSADAAVVDADGRVRRALREVLRWAIEGAGRESGLTVVAVAEERCVRLSVRCPRTAAASAPNVAALLRPLAGDAGVTPGEEGVECWMVVPRA